MVDRTERCRMIALPQADLPGDPAILERVTAYADLCFGVYAAVVVPGKARRGDAVSLRA